MLIAYTMMLIISVPLLKTFGIQGFLGAWMVTEIAHVIYIVHLNMQLFPRELGISARPVIRLGLVLVVALALAAWPCWHDGGWPLPVVAGVAFAATVVLGMRLVFSIRPSRCCGSIAIQIAATDGCRRVSLMRAIS